MDVPSWFDVTYLLTVFDFTIPGHSLDNKSVSGVWDLFTCYVNFVLEMSEFVRPCSVSAAKSERYVAVWGYVFSLPVDSRC